MLAVVLLGLLGSALAVPQTVNRIVGGSDTNVEAYPYMANLQFGWLGIWFAQACGGTLITKYSVLSAAHCFTGDSAELWRVRLGTSLRNSGGIEYKVADIILHELYNANSRMDADVAILKLSSPAALSNTIQVAQIAGSNYNLLDDTSVAVVGWGATQFGGPTSEQLQHVDLDVINQNVCAKRYAYLKTQPGYQNWPDVTDGMLCAGILDVGGKDACQGDSGGPVVHITDKFGHVIVGVTSWGFGCADVFYPGVLARVNHYTDWILANA